MVLVKTFHCEVCGSLLFFENTSCVRCGHALGFLPDRLDLSPLEPKGENRFRALAPAAEGKIYRPCANGTLHDACNWMLPEDDPETFCPACRLNDTIPDLKVSGNLARWQRIERAKRRMVYTILKFNLPTDGVESEGRPALRFRFLGDAPGGPLVLTGHESGMITLSIAEADDEVREQRRVSVHEPFRTVLGHFRHEVAHYYWERLVLNTGWHERFREVFGDETADYQEALAQHYREGPPKDWAQRGVSAYASVHPWEDWAETTAHYFHIVDSLETAAGFGITIRAQFGQPHTQITIDSGAGPAPDANVNELLHMWFPLTYALNALNRGMGLADLYPFVLCDAAVRKLHFVHEILGGNRRFSATDASSQQLEHARAEN